MFKANLYHISSQTSIDGMSKCFKWSHNYVKDENKMVGEKDLFMKHTPQIRMLMSMSYLLNTLVIGELVTTKWAHNL